jgi:hypothetical protein
MYTSKLALAVPALLLALGCSAATPKAESARAGDPDRACAGLPTEARDVSLFAWEGVSFVEARKEQRPIGRAPRQQTTGARVFVPAREGVTQEYVHRAASCQVAQHAASSQQSSDPLAIPGVRVSVSAAQNGYLVDVTAEDAATGRQVLERVRAVTTGSDAEQLAMSVDHVVRF